MKKILVHEFFARLLTSLFAGTLFFGTMFFSRWAACAMFAFLLYHSLREWKAIYPFSSRFLEVSLIIYPALPYVFFMVLSLKFSFPFILYPFLSAWAYDSCAYGVGKLFGKTPMIPRISPSKTWEGGIGGYIGSLLFHYVTCPSFFYHIKFPVVFAAVTSFLSFTGDAFVSWAKRKKGVKDTGSILPGHGGILDRYDSVLFVAYGYLIFLFLYVIKVF